MESAILAGLNGLILGFSNFGWGQAVMILIGSLLLYLGIGKGFEPLLLLPIGFGAILVNIPLAGLMDQGGVLRFFYVTCVLKEIFLILIFIVIRQMTDFQTMLHNPLILI